RDAESPGAVAQDQRTALAEVVEMSPAVLGESGGALDAHVDVGLAGKPCVDGIEVQGDAERGGVAVAPTGTASAACAGRDVTPAVERRPERGHQAGLRVGDDGQPADAIRQLVEAVGDHRAEGSDVEVGGIGRYGGRILPRVEPVSVVLPEAASRAEEDRPEGMGRLPVHLELVSRRRLAMEDVMIGRSAFERGFTVDLRIVPVDLESDEQE